VDNKKSLITDFTSGRVLRQLTAFSTPLLLSGLLQLAYNMVDMVVVGHFNGSAGLSAVSNGGEIINLLTVVALGVSNAGQVLLSKCIGAKRGEDTGRIIGTLFTTLISAAVILTVLCLSLSSFVLRWMKTPEEAWGGTLSYFVICSSGLVFVYGYNLVSAVLRGFGDSVHPFMFVALASGANVGLDMLFVAVFRMGASGAAAATVISQAAACLAAMAFMYRNRELFSFEFRRSAFKPDREYFPQIIKLGLPMALQYAAVSLSKLIITSWINSYGVVVSAVTGVGNKIAFMASTFTQAISTAGSSMIAQNLGAKKYERVPRIIGAEVFINSVLMAVFIVCSLLWPRGLFALFTSDAAVLDMSGLYIPVMVVLFFGNAIRSPMVSLINGSGYSKMNLLVALLDGIVARAGLGVLFGTVFGFGLNGLWYGNAFAAYMPVFIGLAFYIGGAWRRER